MKKLFPLVLILFLQSCGAPEISRDEELTLLEKTVNDFNQAFKSGDLETLHRLTTDNYTHTNSSDRAFAKESWFNYLSRRKQDLESGLLVVNEYALTEMEIQLYNKAAIVTGLMQMSGSNNGESFDRKIRVSNFWVKEDNTWKRAGFHDTRVE